MRTISVYSKKIYCGEFGSKGGILRYAELPKIEDLMPFIFSEVNYDFEEGNREGFEEFAAHYNKPKEDVNDPRDIEWLKDNIPETKARGITKVIKQRIYLPLFGGDRLLCNRFYIAVSDECTYLVAHESIFSALLSMVVHNRI